MKQYFKFFQMIIVINIFCSLFVSQSVPIVNAEDTRKIEMEIVPKEKNLDGTNKIEYLTGENVNSIATFRISGNNVSVPNVKLILKIDKQWIQKVDFGIPDTATTSKRVDTTKEFVMTYGYNQLVGGQEVGLPVVFSVFDNKTLNGTEVPISYEMFDENNVLIGNASIIYKMKTDNTYQVGKYANPDAHYPIIKENGKDVKLVTQSVKSDDLTRTPAEGVSVEYRLSVNRDTRKYGNQYVETIDLIDYLPPEASLSAASVKEGWVYDALTHSASKKIKNSIRAYEKILLDFKNVPTNVIYTNKMESYINRGLADEKKLTNVEEHIKLKLEKYLPTSKIFYSKTGDRSVYTDKGLFKSGGINLEFSDDVKYTLSFRQSHSLEANQADNVTHELSKVEDYNLDGRLYYQSIRITNLKQIPNMVTTDELINQINTKRNQLVGVKSTGEAVILAENVQYQQKVDINDSNQIYTKIELHFIDPLVVDNSGIHIDVNARLTKSEAEKFKNKVYEKEQSYLNFVKYTSKEKGKTVSVLNESGKSYVAPQFPTSGVKGNPKNQTITYEPNYSLSLNSKAFVSNQQGDWVGGMSDEVILKNIILLPSGFEFKQHVKKYGYLHKGNNEIPEIIRNYKNTGKTAVIYTGTVIPTGVFQESFQNEFTVTTLPNMKEGDYEIEHYTVWQDNNRGIKPYHRNPEDQEEQDIYDFDDDGDINEYFAKDVSKIHFLPPYELIGKKEIASDLVNWKLGGLRQDTGDELYYKLSIINNAVTDKTSTSLIDVFPAPGDHAIVSNEKGEYLSRGSQFETPLMEPIENIPQNAIGLQKFDVYYSLMNQGADLSSVRDADWKTKDQITDFTQVKSVKIVLKPGQVLKTKEEVSFITHHKMPVDKSISQLAKAINSLAISSNNIDYVEANKVDVSIVKYNVDGTVFVDSNNNGKIDQSERKLSNYTIELLNENGTPAQDEQGNVYITKTDKNGYYKFDVYKQGKYKVKINKQVKEEIIAQLYRDQSGNRIVGNGGNDVVQDGNNELAGVSDVFVLEPYKLFGDFTATRNAGIRLTRGEIAINKTNEKGEKLEGVVFELKKNGGQVIAEQKTDADGKAIFKNVEFGNYDIVEKSTLDQYILETQPWSISLEETNQFYTLDVVNKLKTPNVTTVKALNPNQSLPVRIGDEVTYTITLTNSGSGDSHDNVVSDVLDNRYDFVSADQSGVNDNKTVKWNVGTLGAGETKVLTVKVKVNKNAKDGDQLPNSVTITNTDTTQPEQPVNPQPVPVALPKVTTVKALDPNQSLPVRIGDEVTYTITLTNSGSGDSHDNVVSDVLDNRYDFVSADQSGVNDNKTVKWNVGTLGAGETKVLTVKVKVNKNAKDGDQLPNSVTITNTDTTQPEQPVNPQPIPVVILNKGSIDLEKMVDKKSVKPGDKLTYSFKVTNTGTVTLKNVKVDDPMFLDGIFLEKTELKPGEVTQGTAYRMITMNDAEIGEVRNTASAIGTLENTSQQVTDISTVVVPVVKEKGKIIISKFDKETHERISGMVFKIYNVETKSDQVIHMQNYNVTEIGDVPVGKYRISETIAPKGYEIDTTVYDLTVVADQETYVNIYDERKTNEATPTEQKEKRQVISLPQTGTDKNEIYNYFEYSISGLAGILFVVWFKSKKKKA